MEWLVIGLFCTALILCILMNWSVLYAMVFGLALFLAYGRHRGFHWKALLRMTLRGVRPVWKILLIFLLIGILTALWRAAGTIPLLVCYAVRLIRPPVFLLMTFLLNCGVSVLLGSSLGTAATMGVVCAAMGTSMGVSPMLTGGAILSGIFFGDRCSPVSTSALLVAEITGTNLYDNIKGMLRSALVPFLGSCVLYGIVGFLIPRGTAELDLEPLFSRCYTLSWLALLPAAAVLLLSVFKAGVRNAMLAGIVLSLPVCLRIQGMHLGEIWTAALYGFVPADEEVASLCSGGGMLSMLNVCAIVSLSSSYTGLFQETGLLSGIRLRVKHLSEKATPFAAVLATSVAASAVSCNQTLAIMLTHQLCADENPHRETFAIDLEDTAVVVSPLIPWSIAGSVPLAATGSPTVSISAAFYLFLLPLWRLLRSFIGSGNSRRSVS